MRRLIPSNSFRKDVRRLTRRGLDPARLASIVEIIENEGVPPPSTRPHRLIGDWSGHFECHVAPDWPLIYQVHDEEVRLLRTGTHSDLFG